MNRETTYDVILLGTGLPGTTLASVLARHGLRVLMLEKGRHPRFAIGEAMFPKTALWLWALSEYFDVPEIQTLCNACTPESPLGTSCGVKRTFGLVYHREGQPQDPAETHKLVPPKLPNVLESHLYREDVDHFMLQTAQAYGADYRDGVTVTSVDTRDDGVTVHTDGATYHGRFLVDGTGFRSVMADRDGLRSPQEDLKTHSRALFSHLRGVRPYDECEAPGDSPAFSNTWHEGTLHHVFDGGWMWIIPFDNTDASENPLCSVGLMLDPRKHPATDASPEEEFWAFVDRFPGIRRHLEGAEAVRPWVRTGRIQYGATAAVGPRYALLSHAYGFVDPLYSQGMIGSFGTVYALAQRLLAGFAEGDLSAARFADLDRMQAAQLAVTDRLVSCAYRSMAGFDLWNAWTHTWLGQELFYVLWTLRAYFQYGATGDREHLAHLAAADHLDADAPFDAQAQTLLQGVEALLDRFEAGEATEAETAEAMMAQLRAADWLPQDVFAWGHADAHHADFGGERLGRLLTWGNTVAPEALRRHLFDFDVPMPAAA